MDVSILFSYITPDNHIWSCRDMDILLYSEGMFMSYLKISIFYCADTPCLNIQVRRFKWSSKNLYILLYFSSHLESPLQEPLLFFISIQLMKYKTLVIMKLVMSPPWFWYLKVMYSLGFGVFLVEVDQFVFYLWIYKSGCIQWNSGVRLFFSEI